MAETNTEPTRTTAEDAAEAAKNITTLHDYAKVRDALVTDSAEATFDFEARPAEPEPIPEEEPQADTSSPEAVEAAPVEDAGPKKAKRPTGKQKSAKSRIDKVVWEREEARKEALSLREQLAALKDSTQFRPSPNAPADPAATPETAALPETAPAGASDQDPEPHEKQFSEYGDFIAAKARWAARQEVGAAFQIAHDNHQAAQAQGMAQQRASQFAERVESLSANDPEFLTRIQPEILNLRPAMSLQEGETPTGATAIADLLVDSENPHQMMEYLSSNEDDFRRISALHPMLAMRELGRIEVGLGAAPHGSAPTPVSSQAAPPIQPVRSSATTSATTRSPADIQTVSEWEVARKKLLHQR
jgi:hypothetical protein